MIKILIVDDSPTETALLKSIFTAEDDFEVVGCSKNGEEAIAMTSDLKPDIITMDILMPVMDGLKATRFIMTHFPIPIVIISSAINNKSVSSSFEALEAGALAVLEKPDNRDDESFAKSRSRIVDTVRSMSTIHVVKRRFYTAHKKVSKTIAKPTIASKVANYEIIVIGASVGGPQALRQIFSKLDRNFPLPIVVVQHMTRGFINGFASWLNNNTALMIVHAEDNEVLKSGTVYFAPDQYHLEVKRHQNNLMSRLVTGPPVSGFCPSITVLFQSVARVCGKNAIGVLLTGMGSDGAQGLLEIKNSKGHTFIQDQETAVVFGMAGVAQSIGAVDKVVELDKIADYLIAITRPKV